MVARRPSIYTLSLFALAVLYCSWSCSSSQGALVIGCATITGPGCLIRKLAPSPSLQSRGRPCMHMSKTRGGERADGSSAEGRAYKKMVQFLRKTGPVLATDLNKAYQQYPGLQAAISRAGGAQRFFCEGAPKWGLRWVKQGQKIWCMVEGQSIPMPWCNDDVDDDGFDSFDEDLDDLDDDRCEDLDHDDEWSTPASMGLYFGHGGYIGTIGDGVMEEYSDSDGYPI
eukprot:TRINITY_DN103467_c0_g1_i1.p1 TRINITY_DN103467_c0_g1~~TRINITY_DN103467_c0_g1_i1.p1  ORF type:complete len:227 (-),score=22.29 TRINITY_DN103467_c0_g1_i1:329-1009(-)